MPYELFWHGKFGAFDNYMNAYNIKLKERMDQRDIEAHTIGFYVIQAMKAVYKLFNPFASKKDKTYDYPAKPVFSGKEYSKEDMAKREETVKAISEHNFIIKAMLESKGGNDDGSGTEY